MGCECCNDIVLRHRVLLRAGNHETGLPPPKYLNFKLHPKSLDFPREDKEYVEDAWPVAAQILDAVLSELRRIARSPEDKRAVAWRRSPAQLWFGDYRARHLRRVRRYFERAHRKFQRGWIMLERSQIRLHHTQPFRGSFDILLA